MPTDALSSAIIAAAVAIGFMRLGFGGGGFANLEVIDSIWAQSNAI